MDVINSFWLGFTAEPRSVPRYTRMAEMMPVSYPNRNPPTPAVIDTSQAYLLHRVDSMVSRSSLFMASTCSTESFGSSLREDARLRSLMVDGVGVN